MTTESTIPMGSYKAEATSTGTEPYKRTYQYTPLSDPKTQFRLATIEPSVDRASQIECTLSVHNLSEPPNYVAISYVCGDPHDTRDVSVDNANLAIYSTLDNAIRHMRKADAPLVLWADALCIHQSDDHEKSLQVGTMSRIYGNADRVFGWLGPANSTFVNALRALESFGTDPRRSKVYDFIDRYADVRGASVIMGDFSHLKSLVAEIARDMTQAALLDVAHRPQNRIEKAFHRVYAKFESRRYSWAIRTIFGPSVSTPIITFLQNSTFFFRTWIYQELALAKRLSLLCGDCSYDGDKVLDGLYAVLSFLSNFMPFRDVQNGYHGFEETVLWWRTRNTIVQLRSSLRDHHQAPVQSLLDLIVALSGASCVDSKDKVFALLALTSDPLVGRNPADYSLSAIQVACRLTRTHVDQTHSLEILRFCGRGNAPSWAMDLGAVIKPRYVKGSSLGCNYHTASALDAKVTLEGANFDPGSFRLAGAHLCTIQNMARLGGDFSRDRKRGPYEEWLRLAKSIGYDELDFWLVILAVPRESYQDNSDEFQSWRGQVRTFMERDRIDFIIDPENAPDWRWPGAQNWPHLHTNEGRKMFVTDSGRLGCCGEHAREGDQVCVLFGGDVPYILRPSPISTTESQYTLVEPCYLDGVMEGELIEKIETGELEEKVFALV